jgi:hypothetical protein
MLHALLYERHVVELDKCLYECYMHDSENVHVNVTRISWKKVFFLNVSSCINVNLNVTCIVWKTSQVVDKCLCKCYTHDLENVHVNVTCIAWKKVFFLNVSSCINVYVNVTCIVWKTSSQVVDKCLCKCYTHDLENVHVNECYMHSVKESLLLECLK